MTCTTEPYSRRADSLLATVRFLYTAVLLLLMEKADLQAGLGDLRKSLRKMKALLAWEQLKQSEARPGQPAAFPIHDPTETELRNEYTYFLSTSVKIHHALNNGSACISAKKSHAIKRQLTKIELEVYRLCLHQRFWKY